MKPCEIIALRADCETDRNSKAKKQVNEKSSQYSSRYEKKQKTHSKQRKNAYLPGWFINSGSSDESAGYGALRHERAKNAKIDHTIVNKIVTNEDELINEKKLYLAILERGIRDYLSANKKHFESAKAWIDSNSAEYPFGFVNICAALGFDKNRLRKKLEELRVVARRNNRNSREIYRILNDFMNETLGT